MNVYFDTGLLVKLYLTEQNSSEATALIQGHGIPICFCGLQQTELRNALYRKCGRSEITERQLTVALKDIQSDMDGGVLQMPDIEWPEIWTNADRLTAKYALATQCRTLDMLHVAVAVQLGIKTFGTTDNRQMVLARKAGLKVISLA
ncbi:MAG TPA: type II toxin-antitoxin system VapC family toxin [Candidatus Methylacidiphilales bacterium]|nr:type II toxin-antitoxin system VapC family toxin [Candidatus Methylacidiphilales bacterium]